MTVVDASVFVAIFRPQDPFHDQSRAWLHAHVQAERPIVVPGLVLAEVAGALARRGEDPTLGHTAVAQLRALPGLSVVPTDVLADRAAAIAADLRLRGADATYVAVAEVQGFGVISWDDEVLARGGQLVPTARPDAGQGQEQP